MPLAAILGLASAFLSLAKVCIEKFVPARTTKKSKEYEIRKRLIERAEKWRLMTNEERARIKCSKRQKPQ